MWRRNRGIEHESAMRAGWASLPAPTARQRPRWWRSHSRRCCGCGTGVRWPPTGSRVTAPVCCCRSRGRCSRLICAGQRSIRRRPGLRTFSFATIRGRCGRSWSGPVERKGSTSSPGERCRSSRACSGITPRRRCLGSSKHFSGRQPVACPEIVQPSERGAGSRRWRGSTASGATSRRAASAPCRTRRSSAADRLGAFYPDLIDPATSAPFAVFHQRFSTNTTPSWERAQPFRMLCHNGEINTIDGNLAHLRAREGALGVGVREEELLRPVADPRGIGLGDPRRDRRAAHARGSGRGRWPGRTARGGDARCPPHGRGGHVEDPALVAFYRYHASVIEPWDGPAALVFTDGIGRRSGRTGSQRPAPDAVCLVCRWRLVVCASEAGVVDLAERGDVRRGALGPGGMLWRRSRARVRLQTDPLRQIARRRPYGRWVAAGRPARADP